MLINFNKGRSHIMKGIRKLFLGLFLMTLIGVGFKVDAKADDELTIEKIQPTSWEWDSSSDDAEPEIVWNLSFTKEAYLPFNSSATVNIGDYTQITYKFGEDDLFNERKLILKRTKTADGDKFSAELIIVQDDGTDSLPTQITVNSDGSGIVEKLFSLSKTEIETQFHNQPASEGTKKWSSNIYCGASLAGYRSNGSQDNSIFSVTSDISVNCPNVVNLLSYQVTATAHDVSGSKLTASINGAGKWYIFFDVADVGITTPPEGYEFIKWTAGDTSTIKSPTVVANDDNSISFLVDEPEVRKAWFGKKHSITISSEPSSGGSVTADKSSAVYDETITLTTEPSSDYVFKEWNIVKPTGLTITNNSFSMPDDDVEIKAVFEKNKVQHKIQVTLDKTINLGKFISDKITDIENEGPYIGISHSGTDTNANNYIVKGKRVTPSSGVSNQLTINGNSVPVIVYDKPRISVGTGTLVLNVPEQVWHDNISYKYVDTTRVKFEGGGTTKYKTYSSGKTFKWNELSNLVKNDLGFSSDSVTMTIYPINPEGSNDDDYDEDLYDKIKLYKVDLNGSEGTNYSVNDTSVGDSYTFYAIGSDDASYKISATPKSGYLNTIEKWEGVSFGTSTSGNASFSESKTIKAYFKTTSSSTKAPSSSSPSSTGRTNAASGSSGSEMDDYDDVPKTGESKADIWILWSVLFVSILGAGFMIWKRFSLVRAIAEADEEVAVAEHKEEVKAKKKEKEDKIKMLKDLRNL